MPSVEPHSSSETSEGRNRERSSMKSKWLTLLCVGPLGLMVWLCPSQGDVALAADNESATTELSSPDQRKCAVELLRQAAAELRANHFDTARSLAKQAADLNATYSLFDVRPEHVLAEIERKERSAGAIVRGSVADPEHPVVQTLKPKASLVAAAAPLAGTPPAVAPPSDPFA